MRLRSILAVLPLITLIGWDAAASQNPATADSKSQSAPPPANPSAQASSSPSHDELIGLPRGKRLVLKDGSYQLVRDYEKTGDRVRYYSIERDQWEVIPTAMVDWDATKKAEESESKSAAALVEKVHIQESANKAEAPVDVDASLLVAPGIFLPDGEGMFAFEGKSIKPLKQVGALEKTDKKTVLKQILTPIPIVPSKRNIELEGTRAAVRLRSATPEFYLRELPADPNQDTALWTTSRRGDNGPDVTLVRARVKGHKRLLESIQSMFGEQVGEVRADVAVQRWEVAPDVFRFTLSAPLPPGEYALAEILPDGLNLYVWDFGVDPAPK
ncbi:MAG TPA: hypothetical protein VJN93_10510 [Candidatus Acidoferrum sp.]|nr:hypothetical protein [Candidatus Acidoferrum sp.]